MITNYKSSESATFYSSNLFCKQWDTNLILHGHPLEVTYNTLILIKNAHAIVYSVCKY